MFLPVRWPNQQCQSTEGGWLVIQIALNLTRLISPCFNNTELVLMIVLSVTLKICRKCSVYQIIVLRRPWVWNLSSVNRAAGLWTMLLSYVCHQMRLMKRRQKKAHIMEIQLNRGFGFNPQKLRRWEVVTWRSWQEYKKRKQPKELKFAIFTVPLSLVQSQPNFSCRVVSRISLLVFSFTMFQLNMWELWGSKLWPSHWQGT